MGGKKAMEYVLRCTSCGREYDEFKIICKCGGTLVVDYHIKGTFKDLVSKHLDVRRYIKLLPIKEEFIPSIIPPITPIVKRRVKDCLIFFKLEYVMPSGSFKDRGTFTSFSVLKETGIRRIVIDSSGNAGISFAMYGLSEGVDVNVFVPRDTSEEKIKLLRIFGARVHIVNGDRDRTHEIARKSSLGLYVGHWYNPFFVEGIKTIAFEVYEQLNYVDYVISPVGSGTLFLGIYNGFRMLHELELTSNIPVMIAAQATGYESICRRVGEEKSVLAEGIMIKNPPRLKEIKDALKATEGTCVSVSDNEIVEALRELFSWGLLVEPTSAVAYAAFKRLMNEDFFEKGSRILIPLTGSGLKFLNKLYLGKSELPMCMGTVH